MCEQWSWADSSKPESRATAIPREDRRQARGRPDHRVSTLSGPAGQQTWNDPHTTSHHERMPSGMHVAEHP